MTMSGSLQAVVEKKLGGATGLFTTDILRMSDLKQFCDDEWFNVLSGHCVGLIHQPSLLKMTLWFNPQ